jgi:hypothetical protein
LVVFFNISFVAVDEHSTISMLRALIFWPRLDSSNSSITYSKEYEENYQVYPAKFTKGKHTTWPRVLPKYIFRVI